MKKRIFFIVLLLAFLGSWSFLKTDKKRARVRQLVRQLSVNYVPQSPPVTELAEMGPGVLPYLDEIIRARETRMDRWKAKLWLKLPYWARERIAFPTPLTELRQSAIFATCSLGPAACRTLNGALCQALPTAPSARGLEPTYILRSIYWSIPESPKAVAALTSYLSDPDQPFLFGHIDSFELWTNLVPTAPLLSRWLSNFDCAREAAIGLGRMGTNAAFAVPLLCEVVTNRFPGETLPFPLSKYGPSIQIFVMNQCQALKSLALVAPENAVARACLKWGSHSTNEEVQTSAVMGLIAVRDPEAVSAATQLVATNFLNLKNVFDSLGTLGTNAQAADWLAQWVDGPLLQRWLDSNPGQPYREEMLTTAGVIALCSVDPANASSRVDYLASMVGKRWECVEMLRDLKSCGSNIVQAMREQVRDSALHENTRCQSAYILLQHAPGDLEALQFLREMALRPDYYVRWQTARYLAWTVGDKSMIRQLVIEGLKSRDSGKGQAAAQLAAEAMEDPAIVSALVDALWHPDMFVRAIAGKTLRRYSPRHLPTPT